MGPLSHPRTTGGHRGRPAHPTNRGSKRTLEHAFRPPVRGFRGFGARVAVTRSGEDGDMENQLQLIETPKDWRLDEETRAIGRQGLRAAREALARAHRAPTEDQRSAA